MLVFVVTSDLKELRRRLVGRGTDDPESIRVRLETARTELGQLDDPSGAPRWGSRRP